MNAEEIKKAVKPFVSGWVAAVHARIYRSTDQSLATATTTVISFDTALANDAGMWSAAAPTKIIAPVDGVYSIEACIAFASNNAGYRRMYIRLNGGDNIAGQLTVPFGTATTTQLSTGTIRRLVAGDYVELFGYQSSGGGLSVTASMEYSPILTMARLGG